MRRALAISVLVGACATEASADTTPLFQVDVGGAYSLLDHPTANDNLDGGFGSVGGISIALAGGVENRSLAIVGTARLDIAGGPGEGQMIYFRQLIGMQLVFKLSPRLRLGVGPDVGFHAGNAWNLNDGGEYGFAVALDLGGTAQLTVDLIKRRWDGSALYLSVATTYVVSPSSDADPWQAMSFALSLGYRASSRATSVFSAPRW